MSSTGQWTSAPEGESQAIPIAEIAAIKEWALRFSPPPTEEDRLRRIETLLTALHRQHTVLWAEFEARIATAEATRLQQRRYVYQIEDTTLPTLLDTMQALAALEETTVSGVPSPDYILDARAPLARLAAQVAALTERVAGLEQAETARQEGEREQARREEEDAWGDDL